MALLNYQVYVNMYMSGSRPASSISLCLSLSPPVCLPFLPSFSLARSLVRSLYPTHFAAHGWLVMEERTSYVGMGSYLSKSSSSSSSRSSRRSSSSSREHSYTADSAEWSAEGFAIKRLAKWQKLRKTVLIINNLIA